MGACVRHCVYLLLSKLTEREPATPTAMILTMSLNLARTQGSCRLEILKENPKNPLNIHVLYTSKRSPVKTLACTDPGQQDADELTFHVGFLHFGESLGFWQCP